MKQHDTVTKMRCGSICTTIVNSGKRDRYGRLLAVTSRTNTDTMPRVREIRDIDSPEPTSSYKATNEETK